MDLKATLRASIPQPDLSDHRQLLHRDADNQHPISAITGLENELAEKARTKKAVVFGDSLFDYPDRYNFAEYLRSRRLYASVSDFAQSGSGWGATYTGTTSLQEKLERSDVRAAVSAADFIYINLSANDIRAFEGIAGGERPDVPEDIYPVVADCLDTIYTLNPSAVILWTPFTSLRAMPMVYDLYPEYGDKTKTYSTMMCMFGIYRGVAEAKNNIFVNDLCAMQFITDLDNDHPTATNVPLYFESVINGQYRNQLIREVPIFMGQSGRVTTYDSIIEACAGDPQTRLMTGVIDPTGGIVLVMPDVGGFYYTVRAAFTTTLKYSFLATATIVSEEMNVIFGVDIRADGIELYQKTLEE